MERRTVGIDFLLVLIKARVLGLNSSQLPLFWDSWLEDISCEALLGHPVSWGTTGCIMRCRNDSTRQLTIPIYAIVTCVSIEFNSFVNPCIWSCSKSDWNGLLPVWNRVVTFSFYVIVSNSEFYKLVFKLIIIYIYVPPSPISLCQFMFR